MKRFKLPAAIALAVLAIAALTASALGYFDPVPSEQTPVGGVDLELVFIEKFNALTPEQQEAFVAEANRITAATKQREKDNGGLTERF